jgi:H/ACA ribonucleoprotein complex subunit 1
MGKEFTPANRGRGGFPRGGAAGRGGGGFSRGRGGPGGFNRGGQDQGPPSYVIPYATFLHKSESNLVAKCTDMSRFPKFNRGVYLENKAKIGIVDEIFGPVSAFFFSIKPVEGVDPKSFKEGQALYMTPEDLLSTDRFTRPQGPRPKGAGGPRGGPSKFGKPIQKGGFTRGPPTGGNFNRGRPAFNKPRGGNFSR